MQSAGTFLGLEAGVSSTPPSLGYVVATEVDMGFPEALHPV